MNDFSHNTYAEARTELLSDLKDKKIILIKPTPRVSRSVLKEAKDAIDIAMEPFYTKLQLY